MVDNRSAGFFGIGGGFNFKSGDISGTASKSSDEKNGPGTEYFRMSRGENEDFESSFFMDRSAQLNASLNSLALINIAAMLSSKKKKKAEEEKRVSAIEEDDSEKGD